MHTLLESIFETRTFLNSHDETVKISSETSRQQCSFLQDIIKKNSFKKSLEIGFAYGISTLAIVEEIAKNGGRHLVIDKFQHTDWKGNGVDLISQAGYAEKLDFFEAYCYTILPKLLEQGEKFDFAYIDSTKQFDWLLVDFFYIDKLLKKNGIVVFDDVNFAGIRKLMRYISQFPDYEVYDQFPKNHITSASRKLGTLLKYLPKSEKYIRNDLLKTDFELGINCSCVALRKTGEDSRYWDWHKDF
jgi:predicted O-methyltransferase YrrM